MEDVEGVVVGVSKEDVDVDNTTTTVNNSYHLHNNTTTNRRLYATNVAHLAIFLQGVEHQSI